MKKIKMFFTLFLICTLLINNFFYEPQKVEAVVPVAVAVVSFVAALSVVAGLQFGADNISAFIKYSGDCYNNDSYLKNWIDTTMNAVGFNPDKVTVPVEIIDIMKDKATENVVDSEGNVQLDDTLVTSYFSGLPLVPDSILPNNYDAIVSNGCDIGENVWCTDFSSTTTTTSFNTTQNKIVVKLYDYYDVLIQSQSAYPPKTSNIIYFIKRYGDNINFYFVYKNDIGTVFSNLLGSIPVNIPNLEIYNPNVTYVENITYNSTADTIAVPSTVEQLVGKTSTDLVTVGGAIPEPTATPDVPYNPSLSNGNWTGSFADNPANLGFGSATGELTGNETGVWTGSWSNAGVWTGTVTLANSTVLTGEVVSTKTMNTDLSIPTGGINFSPLKIAGASLTTKFPFCIPFDFIKSFSVFSGGGTAIPHWEVPMPMGKTLTLDLAVVDPLAPLSRWFFLILFNLGLIIAVNKQFGGVM